MQLCYHNHSFEFKKVDGENTIWDVLLGSADADMVKIELDVAWAFDADVDPVALMDKCGDRIKLLHMKDLDDKRQLAPVGEGIIDMRKVVEKGKEIGIKWYIVEQDSTRKGEDIMDEIAISYKNMVELLA
jgi:sugar phosphate isomerase/epimerase